MPCVETEGLTIKIGEKTLGTRKGLNNEEAVKIGSSLIRNKLSKKKLGSWQKLKSNKMSSSSVQACGSN